MEIAPQQALARPSLESLRPAVAYAGRVLALAAVYLVTAKVGLALAVAHGNVTPVWAPTGISLAALLLFGRKMWPGVALGAFVANATTQIPLAVAMTIAAGNTLEAVVGAALLRRAGFRNTLHRLRDVVALVSLGAVVSTTISATFGVTSLWLAGIVPGAAYDLHWGIWWFGDAMGDLLVAPFLLVWLVPVVARRRIGGSAELIGMLAVLSMMSWVVFINGNWNFPYLLLPPVLWAAVRFRQRGITVGVVVVSGFAIWATLDGGGPAPDLSLTTNVALVQTMMAIASASLLLLAATMSRRDEAEREIELRERELEEAQALAHIGSWEWDIGANVVTWSDELYRIYGLEPQQFAADYDAFTKLLHPDDRDRVDEIIQRSFQTCESFSFEHRLVRPAGAVRWLHGRGEVIADENGRPIRMLGTAQDITERKMAEAALRNSEEQTRAVFEHSAVGIAVVAPEGRFIQANSALCRMTGYSESELRGKALTDITHDPDRYDDVVAWADLHGGSIDRFVVDKRLRRRDGKLIWVSTTTSLIGGADRNAVVIVEDITERKQFEALREDFIANAAHELRTPLTSLAGFGTVLAERRADMTEAQIDQATKVIQRQGERVTTLVNNLLDFSQMERGSLRLALEPVLVARVAADALESAPPPPGMQVEIIISRDLTVTADRMFLERIVTNLLTNAYRYGRGPVRVEAVETDDGVILAVSDRGHGVPIEFVPHLFEPFSRAFNTPRGQGSGLGLAITRRLVEALGGSISYAPSEPRGACFTVHLPGAAPARAPALEVAAGLG